MHSMYQKLRRVPFLRQDSSFHKTCCSVLHAWLQPDYLVVVLGCNNSYSRQHQLKLIFETKLLSTWRRHRCAVAGIKLHQERETLLNILPCYPSEPSYFMIHDLQSKRHFIVEIPCMKTWATQSLENIAARWFGQGSLFMEAKPFCTLNYLPGLWFREDWNSRAR